jgi:hypothetical protein
VVLKREEIYHLEWEQAQLKIDSIEPSEDHEEEEEEEEEEEDLLCKTGLECWFQ